VKGSIAEAYWFAEIFKDTDIPKLYVLGNHDYWLYNFYEGRSKYTDFYEHLKDINKAMRVNGFHNLSDSPVVVDDIAFCGACGWYDGSLEELVELSEEDIKLKQRIISNGVFHIPANITPERLIERDLEILEPQLEEVSDVPV
jgi:predicted phosphohydrolase